MNGVTNLAEKRWETVADTRKHTVLDTLRVAIARIEKGDMVADHIIIVTGTYNEDSNGNGLDWMQAGKFNFYEQVGMLERLKISLCTGAEAAE